MYDDLRPLARVGDVRAGDVVRPMEAADFRRARAVGRDRLDQTVLYVEPDGVPFLFDPNDLVERKEEP